MVGSGIGLFFMKEELMELDGKPQESSRMSQRFGARATEGMLWTEMGEASGRTLGGFSFPPLNGGMTSFLFSPVLCLCVGG